MRTSCRTCIQSWCSWSMHTILAVSRWGQGPVIITIAQRPSVEKQHMSGSAWSLCKMRRQQRMQKAMMIPIDYPAAALLLRCSRSRHALAAEAISCYWISVRKFLARQQRAAYASQGGPGSFIADACPLQPWLCSVINLTDISVKASGIQLASGCSLEGCAKPFKPVLMSG